MARLKRNKSVSKGGKPGSIKWIESILKTKLSIFSPRCRISWNWFLEVLKSSFSAPNEGMNMYLGTLILGGPFPFHPLGDCSVARLLQRKMHSEGRKPGSLKRKVLQFPEEQQKRPWQKKHVVFLKDFFLLNNITSGNKQMFGASWINLGEKSPDLGVSNCEISSKWCHQVSYTIDCKIERTNYFFCWNSLNTFLQRAHVFWWRISNGNKRNHNDGFLGLFWRAKNSRKNIFKH